MPKPYCLLLHKTFPQKNLDDLSEIVTLVSAEEPISDDILKKITYVAASPMIGMPSIWFEKLPNLKLISVFGVGTDKIDIKEARRRGIDVTTTLNVLTEDVTDMAFALLLSLTRMLVSGDRFIRDGRWTRREAFPLATSIRGKRLGVVGMGAIGHDIARRGEAFGMKPTYFNRSPKADAPWKRYESITALAAECDVLIAAISATPETTGIINRNVLEALGPQGYFINIARGAVVNEDDLIDALRNKKIAGAGLDVFLNEPDIDKRFFGIDNVLLAPHIASATIETRIAMGQNVIDNINASIRGAPLLTLIN